MTAHLLKFDLNSMPAVEDAPAPERVIAGSPVHRTWNFEDTGDGVYAGIWESTPGEWKAEYSEWEFCHFLSGVSILTEDGGEAVTLKAGDAFVIKPGFKGTWKVVETTLKHYVIRN